MADDMETYPYLIPLIWQTDTNVSPNVVERGSLYNAGGLPHAQWGGRFAHVGAGNVENVYPTRYNTVAGIMSPLQLDLSVQMNGNSQVNITARANLMEDMEADDNRIVFILTYDFDYLQPSTYAGTVVRYAEQSFGLTKLFEEGTFTQTFSLSQFIGSGINSENWDLSKTTVVAFVQSFTGDKVIHQASSIPLDNAYPPANLKSFSSPVYVQLLWEQLNTNLNLLGYNVFRNGEQINKDIVTDTFYHDYSAFPNHEYRYTVETLYEDRDPVASKTLRILTDSGMIQLGSGGMSSGAAGAFPVNTYANSLRGQFVYTVDEFFPTGVLAGLISSVGLFVTEPPAGALPDFTIRIKYTSASNAANHDNGPFINTTTIDQFIPVQGWNDIELSEPIYWDGMGNLLFDTAFAPVIPAHASGQLALIRADKGYRYVRGSGNAINATTGLTENAKPQIRLNLSDINFNIVLGAPRNPAVSFEDRTTHLSWESPVSRNTLLLGYDVYRNGEKANSDLVTELFYLDNGYVNNSLNSYHIIAVYSHGDSDPSPTIEITSEFDPIVTVHATSLGNNFPNPFNPSTTIYYDLHQPSHVKLEIYNVRGQLVNTLLNEYISTGAHSIIWNGSNAQGHPQSSGIYFYRLQTDTFSETKRMVLMK